MTRTYIGKPVTRLEDRRLLTGAGSYIDDVKLPGISTMAILRSPYAHARIRSIDLESARAMEGVIDAFCAADLDAQLPVIPLRLAPFDGFERFLQRPIAIDKVRYVGEPVAVVIAEDRYVAEDALELIEVEFDQLPTITTIEQATAGNTLIHEAAGENMGTRYTVARGNAKAAFDDAAYTRRERFVTNRHGAVPMETRGLIAEFDPEAPLLRLHGATKVNFFNRRHLAAAFELPETSVELIETDVGGGFGARGELYPEDYLVSIASRRTGGPVKWIEDRRENLTATNHSRDIVCELEIAATAEGEILGMRATVQGDMGAYIRTNGGVVPSKAAQFLPGPYRVPSFSCDVQFLVTNKTPVGTFRGPGRFEANFCRERILDMMADDLGIDPAELRRRNLMTPRDLPYRIGELVPGDPDATLDRGNYPAALEHLLNECGYADWNPGTETNDGRVRGMGIACFIESSAAGPPESARITVFSNGRVEIRTGASSVGQGTETGLAQICAEFLDIDMNRIDVLHGSTTLVEIGGGTFHSRNTVMAGNATRTATEALKDRATELAALRWNCDAKDLSYDDGAVNRDSDRLTLQELAAFAETRGETLSADALFDNEKKMSYSYGAHAAQIAIDIATGVIEVERYWLTEEIGRALNPAMVQGQAVGGVIQGLGGTFLDHFVYDEDGQLLTGSLADYLLPTTSELPDITAIALENSPSEFNPMGFKGAGEGGIVAVAGAVGNAVAQALKPYGVSINELPLTPDRLRKLLRGAGA
ncbi:MAG: xanthine dehydrogenase family protein molybdopterin-binding subunit [Rhodospirillaceae bacterium]|nr:MAG: xanthine dehydrogenase family protein molybdopterin-binding subunit [Rhodospirillaceae bacterium]